MTDTTTTATEVHTARSASVTLIFVAPEGVIRARLHEGDSILVGRVAPADVVIASPSVSRAHARFSLVGGLLQVVDAGSKNGLSIGEAVVRSARLGPGDCVRLGEVDVWVGGGANVREPEKRLLGPRRFAQRLDEELDRTHYSLRPVYLCALLGPVAGDHNPWLCNVINKLDSVDRACEYAPHIALCLLIEKDAARAVQVVEQLRSSAGEEVRAAVIGAPPAALQAEALVALVLDGVHRVEPARTVLLGTDEAPAPVDAPVIVSDAMKKVLELASRAGHADIPVLIGGETGAGKEVTARAFHERGGRASGPFCEVNCAAIAPGLLESVLFGHEKGAFTGADKRSLGVFEQASGGTIFLDEIGELSAAAQSALLRVLETKRLRRLGGTQEIQVDVRVIAATHRDVRRMVEEGKFREDLLYRLEGLTVRVPPLRERPEEIEPLAAHFLSGAAKKWNTPAREISDAARGALRRYSWPGNVRQLRNAIERAAAVCATSRVELDDLPDYLFEHGSEAPRSTPTSVTPSIAPLVDVVREFEAARIREALSQAGGNQSQAARLLGIPRRTLGGKIKELGIE